MLRQRAICAATTICTLLLLGGCADAGTATTASPVPPGNRATARAPAQPCTPAARTVCITPSAAGHTVTLPVRSAVDVDLRRPGSVWSGLSEVGPHLLRPDGAVRYDAGAISASYEAVAPGRTALRAIERPRCAPTRACPQFIVLWQVAIRVRR
jgi:hypothetical protein